MDKIKSIFNKRNILIAGALTVALVGYFGFFGKGNNNNTEGGIITNGVRTTVLRHTTLSDSVTVTGTVESVQTINITSTTEGTTVQEILVQVGDSVAKDRIIMKLDSGTILERIEKEKERLADSYETAYKRREDAEEARDDAKDRIEAAENARDVAYTDMKNKKSELDNAKADFDVAKTGVQREQEEYNAAVNEEEAAIKNYSNETKALKDRMEKSEKEWEDSGEPAEAGQTLYDAYITAKNNYDNLHKDGHESSCICSKCKLTQAKNKVSETVELLKNAKALVNYDNLDKVYTDAKSAYDMAVSTCNTKDKAVDTREDTYEQKKEAYEDYLEDLEDYTTSDTLEDLYEQYNDCIIKAPENGTVTAINVEVGGSANGTLAVIQDTSHLKISTSFAESDVQNIKIGMKCSITSDANDNVISGYVSQISPTAGSGSGGMGMGSSSGDVSFAAEITINGTDHGLLIGMNAQADVILSQIDNVFIVPYDAVGTNENGEKVVYVQSADDKDNFTPVVVTTGMETDYYIEISSDSLSEGMVIRSSANRYESGNEMFVPDDVEEEMSGMGGFGNIGGFGGGMPSGGRPQGMPSGGGMPGGRG